MLYRVLSLDIASTTGWAFTFGQARGKFQFGIIKTNSKFSEGQRLAFFRGELIKLFMEFRPSHVVIEDVYAGNNINTLKLLAKYAGVAQEVCVSIAGVDPYIIHNGTVKSYFKAKNKRELFDFMVELMGWENDDLNFNKHNDIIDAIGQLICYYDQVLGARKFREEKEYGFLYNIF